MRILYIPILYISEIRNSHSFPLINRFLDGYWPENKMASHDITTWQITGKSTASQHFVTSDSNENIKAPLQWTLVREVHYLTGIPLQGHSNVESFPCCYVIFVKVLPEDILRNGIIPWGRYTAYVFHGEQRGAVGTARHANLECNLIITSEDFFAPYSHAQLIF